MNTIRLMNSEYSLKAKVIVLLIVYVIARLYQSTVSWWSSDAFANLKKPDTNIVALIVDKQLYADGQVEKLIERYARDYIQQRISNSKAVIFPIDTKVVQAWDIAHMLENLYLDGIEKEPSTLEGVILIGDQVPLPIVNDKGAIFPSLFPYTDFDQPKFYRDPDSQYFISNGIPNAQAEVRHGVIKLDGSVSDYVHFFKKLQQYVAQPTHYVGDRMWYDDFIDQKQSYNDLARTSYLNNFVFAEDIGYHRYNPLMIDLLNQRENAKNADLVGELASLQGSSGSYASQVGQVFSEFMADSPTELGSDTMQISTVFVDDALQGFQKKYSDLYGVTSRVRMRDNVGASARWDQEKLDSHASKIEYFDALYTKQLGEAELPILVQFNKQFEDVLLSSVKKNAYPLQIAIPTQKQVQNHYLLGLPKVGGQVVYPKDNSFPDYYYDARIAQVFYYGKNAQSITGLDQTSIFFGTPNPIAYSGGQLASMTGVVMSGSLGVSQGVFSELIEANRGYVMDSTIVMADNALSESICGTNMSGFLHGYWGGNTPLNISGAQMDLLYKEYNRPGEPTLSNILFVQPLGKWPGSLLNMAGARRVLAPQDWMYPKSFAGGSLQTVFIQRRHHNGSPLFSPILKKEQYDLCAYNPDNTESLASYHLYSGLVLPPHGVQETRSIGSVKLMEHGNPCTDHDPIDDVCRSDGWKVGSGNFAKKHFIDYKLIDSLLVHTSPTPEQIKQFIMTTQARPIDSRRYMMFQGIGGDWVRFDFPNLYEVPVYKQDPDHPKKYLLKTQQEIKQAIHEYLKQKISDYNATLSHQNQKKQSYYATYTGLFDALEQIDPLATPNRHYTLLHDDLFTHLLSEEVLDMLATMLFMQNSLLPYKYASASVKEEFDQLYDLANLTNKKQHIIREYLTTQQPSTPLTLPGYQGSGYELISLVSDGDDSIHSDAVPEWVSKIQAQQDAYSAYQQNIIKQQQVANTPMAPGAQACAGSLTDTVPLVDVSTMTFPWFDAFACWLQHIAVPKFSVNFKNAQGPVFIPSDWKLFASYVAQKPNAHKQESFQTFAHEVTSQGNLSAAQQSLLSNFEISLSQQTYSLADAVPLDLRPVVTIVQKKPQYTTVRIASTGDVCLLVNKQNTCTKPYQTTITDSHYISPYLVPASPKVGKSVVSIELCQHNVCVIKKLAYFVTPGDIAQLHLPLQGTKFVSHAQVPLFVGAKDKHNNELSAFIPPIVARVQTGSFVGGATEFSFANTRQYAQLQLPRTQKEDTVTIELSDKTHTITANKKLSVHAGTINIVGANSYYKSSASQIVYPLPPKKSQVFLADGKINTALLPQLTVQLQSKNKDPLIGPVVVKSQEGLFTVHQKFGTGTLMTGGQLQRVETLMFDGKRPLSLVLQPQATQNIGSDVLIFLFPDGTEQRIPVVIQQSEQVSRIVLDAPANGGGYSIGETVPLVVQLFDDWGNRVQKDQNVVLEAAGAVTLQGPSNLMLEQGKGQFVLKATDGGVGYVRAFIPTQSTVIPGLWKGHVKQSIIPTSNINGLYLNLAGTNWGNSIYQEFDHYNFVPSLMKTSKVLATTTELASPAKIPVSIVQVNAKGELFGPQSQEWMLTTSGSYILAQHPDAGRQVIVGNRDAYPWAQHLVPATQEYPIDFTLYTLEVPSAGSSQSPTSIAIVDSRLQYSPSKNDALEESSNPTDQIGRRHEYHHLTQFAQGKTVGEATVMHASEFVINYGDPLITRPSKNPILANTPLDSGPGQLIVSESQKTIQKAIAMDVNNDGLDDVVTVFTDGSVIWSKQYGGKESILVEMGPLLQIYGGIKQVFGADTQGDGFDDLVVQTQDDELRVYTNQLGIFSVDGYPICVDEDQPTGMEHIVTDIDQWFLEDMDQDTKADIVLNKAGEIRIIYGGKSGNGYSYISQDTMKCDARWRTRQKSETTVVDHIGIQLHTGASVDSSLIRRKGLVANESNQDALGSATTTPSIANTLQGIFSTGANQDALDFTKISGMPVNAITNQAMSNVMRWSTSPISLMPSYETVPEDQLRYVSIAQLAPTDQVRVTKTYTSLGTSPFLRKGDTVKVKVVISGLRNDAMTYLERIQGPWKISFASGVIAGWDPGTLPASANYHSITPQGDYYFAVDNIQLGASNVVEFSYELVFQGVAGTKIKILDRNHDTYPDIVVYPLDGCAKFLWNYINKRSLVQSYKTYDKQFVDLASKLQAHYQSQQGNAQNYLSGALNSIKTITGSTSSMTQVLQGLGHEPISFSQLFQQALGQGGTSLNFNMNFLGTLDKKIQNTIQGALDSICGGGKQSSCSRGLPIPFNMAFLSPGTYNIMGCTPKVGIPPFFPDDAGFPVVAFPANFHSPVGPIPLPFPWGGIFKGPTDTYGYGFPSTNGPYSSLFRIYFSPTLTQQLGVAICIGPQTIANKIPSPFNAIGGNCIVTALKMSAGTCDSDASNGGDSGLTDTDTMDLAEFGQCTKSAQHGGAKPPLGLPQSPFTMVGVKNGTIVNTFPEGTYFGIVNFEKTPIVVDERPTEGVVLKGGNVVTPQIQGGGSKGLVACIVKDWMDRQTNYIVNNFTNMQIGVYLPQVSQLGEGFDNLNSQLQAQTPTTPLTDRPNDPNTLSGNFISQLRNSTIQHAELENLATSLNNPFEEIQKMFAQTPLINIETQDVVVKVPTLYSEDITRYEAMLKSWLERNREIVQDWKVLVDGAVGVCSAQVDMSVSDAASQLKDKTYFQKLYTALGSRHSALQVQLQDGKSCQNNERKQCSIYMAQHKLTSPAQGDAFVAELEQLSESTYVCMGIVDKILNSLLGFLSYFDELERKIHENVRVLEQYKRFPLQLYQWIHVVDRYLGEVVSSVENFLGYIALWLNTNATRFEQYVDAIITISTALETWQAILNLSVDWQRRCSTCTVDNYDAYACSLGSLCSKLKLPVLRLPPFKIPNIYIDMSHIDVGMDIVLPNFQFIPTSVPLPDLPDLPQPPTINFPNGGDMTKLLDQFLQQLIGIKGGVRDIPVLPPPPVLPELPSFIPTIDLELPVLPPAPSIPKIAPEIETVIKVVGFFSKVYCIIKGGIGLVGERNVKTRIEHLTQRTRQIPFFDNLNLTQELSYPQDKLVGFDYEIDAYVNFAFNFTQVYDLIKVFADSINQQTDKLVERDPNKVFGMEQLNDNLSKINSHTQQNINLANPFGYHDSHDGHTLQAEQTRIRQLADYISELPDTKHHHKQQLQALKHRLDHQTRIVAKIDALQALQESITDGLQESRRRLGTLSAQIHDYDNFVGSLKTDGATVQVYQGKEQYATTFYEAPHGLSLPQESLMHGYIGLQKKLLSHYNKGLSQVKTQENATQVHTLQTEIAYLDKGLDAIGKMYEGTAHRNDWQNVRREYNPSDELYYNAQAAVCTTDESHDASGLSDPNVYPSMSLMAQTHTATSSAQNSFDAGIHMYDFSVYKQQLMVPFAKGTGTVYVDVLQSDYFAQTSQGHTQMDINHDNHTDILHRSESQVWIKYGQQEHGHIKQALHTHTDRLFVAPVWDEVHEWQERTNDQGYLKIAGSSFKLSSPHWAVKNLRVKSQDYDSFSLSWTNSERQHKVDGYMLEITTVPDGYHLKAHADLPKHLQSRYVMFVPEGTDTDDLSVYLHNQIKRSSLKKLMPDTVIDVVHYDRTTRQLTYSFTELPRAWYYTRVASLEALGKKKKNYTLASAWSRHVVAGQQLIADTDGPTPQVRLIRERTQGVVDTGLNPQGIVNTQYRLQVDWDDPSGVAESWISTETGTILAQHSGSSVALTNLYLEEPQQLYYRIGARDSSNNTAHETVLLVIAVPTLVIDDIVKSASTHNAFTILSSISKGMDAGQVQFERKRNNVWTTLTNPTMTGSQTFAYPLGFDQIQVSGGPYNQHKGFEFMDNAGKVMAIMDPSNGKITIMPAYKDKIQIQPDIAQQVVKLLLKDRATQQTLFTIQPKLTHTVLQAGYPYQVQTLTGGQYGSFAGGSCIMNTAYQCMVAKNAQGDVVVNAPFHHTIRATNYQFDNGTSRIQLVGAGGELIGSLSFTATLP